MAKIKPKIIVTDVRFFYLRDGSLVYKKYKLTCNECKKKYWVSNNTEISNYKKKFCRKTCYNKFQMTSEKRCVICSEKFGSKTTFCKKHGKAIKKWIDLDDGKNARLWLYRNKYKQLIAKQLYAIEKEK